MINKTLKKHTHTNKKTLFVWAIGHQKHPSIRFKVSVWEDHIIQGASGGENFSLCVLRPGCCAVGLLRPPLRTFYKSVRCSLFFGRSCWLQGGVSEILLQPAVLSSTPEKDRRGRRMSTVYIFILNGFSKRQKLSGFFCVPPAVTAAHTDELSVFTLHVWELRCHWLVLRILDLRSVRWRNKICWASCSFQSFRMVYSDRGGCVCVSWQTNFEMWFWISICGRFLCKHNMQNVFSALSSLLSSLTLQLLTVFMRFSLSVI